MSLQYILSLVSVKMGLNPSDSSQRATMLRFVNSAAKEVYQTSDMAGCLSEELFKVNSDQTIALPDYIGQIRAMRESYSHNDITLSQMRPRYNQINWEFEWKNWRLKGISPLRQSIHNEAQVKVVVPAVEDTPVVVTITGSTANASSVSETVTMTTTSWTSVNAYTSIKSFTKSAVNAYDVKLLDIDDNEISYIANNKLSAAFQIVDISTAPWYNSNTNPQLQWVEVLYKKALPWFSNDSDEFPAVGYDDVIVNKCLQLWFEEQGNVNIAVAYQEKATGLLAQIHEDANRGTDDTVSLCRNPHDRINPRTGFGRDWKWAYRISGR